MLLEDALEEYEYHCLAKGFTQKTMKNKLQEYKQLKRFLKEKRGIIELESITVFDLKAHFREKQKAGLQPSSIVSMHKMITAFFNWCHNEGYLAENLMRKVERPKVPKKVLKGFTPKEVQSMIEAFSNKEYLEVRNKAIVAMLADCGLRSMEIRGLKTSNVNTTTLLVNGKGNKERTVFISPKLKKILIRYERLKKEYFADRPTSGDHYFLTYTGNCLSHVALFNIIKEAGRRAKVEEKRVSPHTFRHFYSVQSLSGKNGLDLHSLSMLLGHSSVEITQRYLSSMTLEQLSEKAIKSSPLMNI